MTIVHIETRPNSPPLLARRLSDDRVARRGSLRARLATEADEVAAAQVLRHRVFFRERGLAGRMQERDCDRFDNVCDHLLVVETRPAACKSAVPVRDGELVGTYRLLRQDAAERHGGFYTQAEFDIGSLIARKPGLRFLELGRSCVDRHYRTKPVIELLWQGIWNYVRAHRLDVMLGCASFEGTDPDAVALPLSFLAREFRAPEDWRVAAVSDRYVGMNRLGTDDLDPKTGLALLPPLIKGYLRLGAFVGDGAVIDHEFNTVDVLIVLPVASINSRYFSRFGEP